MFLILKTKSGKIVGVNTTEIKSITAKCVNFKSSIEAFHEYGWGGNLIEFKELETTFVEALNFITGSSTYRRFDNSDVNQTK